MASAASTQDSPLPYSEKEYPVCERNPNIPFYTENPEIVKITRA